jgi:DNA-binding ferritin-like protein
MSNESLITAEFPPMEFSRPKVDKGQLWIAVFKKAYNALYASQIGHWNVIDPRFNDLHSFFGHEYDDWAKLIDDIAEHARTHDVLIPSSLEIIASAVDVVPQTSVAATLIKSYKDQVVALGTFLAKNSVHFHALADNDLAGELARHCNKTLWKIKSMADARLNPQTAVASNHGDEAEEYLSKLKASKTKNFVQLCEMYKSEKQQHAQAFHTIAQLHTFGAKLIRIAGRVVDGDASAYVITFNILDPEKFFTNAAKYHHIPLQDMIYMLMTDLEESKKKLEAVHDEDFERAEFFGTETDPRPLDVILTHCSNP